MATADFYNALMKTRGIAFTKFEHLTSAEQQPFADAYSSIIGVNTDDIAGLLGSEVKTARLVVANNNMKTLRATSLTVVPAIANRIIIPLRVIATTPQATTARTGAVNVRLRWRVTSTSHIDITGDIDITTMQGSTTTARSAVVIPASAAYGEALASLVALPAVVHNVGAAEYGAGSTDNIVTFRVIYFLLEL